MARIGPGPAERFLSFSLIVLAGVLALWFAVRVLERIWIILVVVATIVAAVAAAITVARRRNSGW